MIKLKVHVFAGTFLKPIVLYVEDVVATFPEDYRRRIVLDDVCRMLNDAKWKNRKDWIPSPSFHGRYTVPFVDIMNAKRI